MYQKAQGRILRLMSFLNIVWKEYHKREVTLRFWEAIIVHSTIIIAITLIDIENVILIRIRFAYL